MAKLMIYYKSGKRHKPFHPRLIIDVESGFCRNQWVEQHFKEGVFCGAGCVRHTTVQVAVETYFRELRRMNYTKASTDENKLGQG